MSTVLPRNESTFLLYYLEINTFIYLHLLIMRIMMPVLDIIVDTNTNIQYYQIRRNVMRLHFYNLKKVAYLCQQ